MEKLKKPENIILFGIIITTLFLRLFMLSSYPPSLYADEAVNGVNTLQALESHQFKIFYLENNGREGLFINVQAFFVWFFGPDMWVLHIASVLFSVLTVLGLYLLTKKLLEGYGSPNFAKLTALVAAFLLATSFWHINFSRIGFRAITAPFWAVWAFYLLLITREKLMGAGRINKDYFPWALIAGAIFGLGFHSYISYRVMPAVVLVLFLYWFFETKHAINQPGILKDYFWCVGLIILGAVITASPLLVHFARVPQDFLGRTSQISIFSSQTPLKDLTGNILKTLGMFNLFGDFNQRQNMAGQPELFWLPGIMFLVGLYLACRSIIKKIYGFFLKTVAAAPDVIIPSEIATPAVYFFLLTWLAVAALPVVISNEGIPHALRSILMIPPVFILTGLGTVNLYFLFIKKLQFQANPERWQKVLKSSTAVVAVLLILDAYTSYFVVWGNDPKTKDVFNYDYNEKAYELRALPDQLIKYAVYDPGEMGINITQFLTDTATPQGQIKHNLYYVPRGQVDLAHPPMGIYVTDIK